MADQPYNDESGSGRGADAAFADYWSQAKQKLASQGVPMTNGNMNAALEAVQAMAAQNPNQMVNVEDLMDQFNLGKGDASTAGKPQAAALRTPNGNAPVPGQKPSDAVTASAPVQPAAAQASDDGSPILDAILYALGGAGVGVGAAALNKHLDGQVAAQGNVKAAQASQAETPIVSGSRPAALPAPDVIYQEQGAQPKALPPGQRAFNDPINLDATGVTSAPPADAKPFDYNGQKMFIDTQGAIYDPVGRKIANVPAEMQGVARTLSRAGRVIK
jgi:hypothetical protein